MMRPSKSSRIFTAILGGAVMVSPSLAAAPQWDTFSDTWVGTDGLGRPLPTYEDVGPPNADKNVAMFYYMWADGRDGIARDMAKALAKDPNFRAPVGQWWWWGEPVLGYYLQQDPFVCKTHASELSDAGVDAVFFDSTNGFIHEPQYTALCKTYEAIRALGQGTPAIAHVTHAQSLKTVQALYDEFYSKGLYSDLWYRWDGKPIILSESDQLTPLLKNFFTVRNCWAFHSSKKWFGDGHDRWAWIDSYPQQYGWDTSPNVPEEISVSAAQHPSSYIGRSYTYSAGKEPGPGQRDPGAGSYFAEQWTQALKVSPPVVFTTNWNEWIAKSYKDDFPKGKPRHFIDHSMSKGEGFFVDEYDPEFSRDIEPAMPTPANRGVEDNYYYQLVANIRRYKGVRPLSVVSSRPIAIDGDFSKWLDVAPEFRDTIGDPVHRDSDGYTKGVRYVNQSGRNDIVAAKVSADANTIYFYVRTAQPLTPHTDPDWMLLYLDVDHDAKTGWLGYDFVVNRGNVGEGRTTLQNNVGGRYAWSTVSTDIAYSMHGNEMELAIPRSLLRLKAGPATIDFKWADHCFKAGDWTDFTLNGDAAPDGRFNFRAKIVSP